MADEPADPADLYGGYLTFPIVQAGTLLLNTLAILVIYREKPNKPTVISLVLLCAGIVCISL